MTSTRSTDRFFIDLLGIDALPRSVRPAFLEWARALDAWSLFVRSEGQEPEPEEFPARVRLEAARRHAVRICQAEELDSHPRVLDLMVYLSWNPSDFGHRDRLHAGLAAIEAMEALREDRAGEPESDAQ